MYAASGTSAHAKSARHSIERLRRYAATKRPSANTNVVSRANTATVNATIANG